jgi:hypothetical protein
MNSTKIVRIIKGIATFIPFIKGKSEQSTGGTSSARYCYSVWLRHLIYAKNNGYLKKKINTIAELGPGDSLGVGIAALLSGIDKYYAFDTLDYTNIEKNLQIFDELIILFNNKTDIPNEDEFPKLSPNLKSNKFPIDILSDVHLKKSLHPDRINKIRDAIKNYKNKTNEQIEISYFAPWEKPSIIKKKSVDMIFSQAVMEHVINLEDTYKSMYQWLKVDGFISHTVDLKSHGTASKWNGHWEYSNFVWKLICGGRLYLINREPYSTHINLIKKAEFKNIKVIKLIDINEIKKNNLAKRFQILSNEDLTIRGFFVQANK